MTQRASGCPRACERGGTERSLKAGQSLFRLGDKTAGLYEIVKGKVRLVRIDASGRETVFYFAGPGNVVAEAVPVLAGLSLRRARVGELGRTLLSEVRNPRGIPARSGRRAELHGDACARDHAPAHAPRARATFHSARDRVRHYLALNAASDGRTVALPGTIKELAAELGLSHEALYRTLAAMQRDGEIVRGRRRITLARQSYDRDHT